MQTDLERKLGYLNHDPNNVNLLADIADGYIRLGEFEQARQHIEHGLSVAGDSPALQFVQSTLSIASNDPDSAITVLEEMQADNAAEAVIYNLAYAYLLKFEPEKAKDTLLPVIDRPDLMPEALLLFARACHHMGDMDEAEEYGERYVSQRPDDAEGVGVLALIKGDMQADDAVEWADKALALDENNVEGLVTQGSVALNNFSTVDAIPHFEKAVAVKPSSGRAHAGLGLIYMANQDLLSARASLESAVKHMPNHIGTWHALAWSQILLVDLEAAKQSFEAANEIDHSFGETYGGLAVIAVMENKIDDAKVLCKKALGLNKASFAARYAQMLMLAKSGGTVGNEKVQKMMEQVLNSEVTEGSGSLKDMLVKLQSRR